MVALDTYGKTAEVKVETVARYAHFEVVFNFCHDYTKNKDSKYAQNLFDQCFQCFKCPTSIMIVSHNRLQVHIKLLFLDYTYMSNNILKSVPNNIDVSHIL